MSTKATTIEEKRSGDRGQSRHRSGVGRGGAAERRQAGPRSVVLLQNRQREGARAQYPVASESEKKPRRGGERSPLDRCLLSWERRRGSGGGDESVLWRRSKR